MERLILKMGHVSATKIIKENVVSIAIRQRVKDREQLMIMEIVDHLG
jgi:hypothetical protein